MPPKKSIFITKHEGGENYNNNIQLDFIAKLKKRYLFTEDTINSTDEKSRNFRMPEDFSKKPTEEDVKNMLKSRLHKKLLGTEHEEWQSAKYKTMEETVCQSYLHKNLIIKSDK